MRGVVKIPFQSRTNFLGSLVEDRLQRGNEKPSESVDQVQDVTQEVFWLFGKLVTFFRH